MTSLKSLYQTVKVQLLRIHNKFFSFIAAAPAHGDMVVYRRPYVSNLEVRNSNDSNVNRLVVTNYQLGELGLWKVDFQLESLETSHVEVHVELKHEL